MKIEESNHKSSGHQDRTETSLRELVRLSCRLGATDAAVLSTDAITIEDRLANLCREPRCENYGLSAKCPPNVSGPSGFRKILKDYEHAIAFKIDLPSEILLSSQRREVFTLLHEIAAAVEQSAVEMGFSDSKAFAGGSCKQLFCNNHADCRVLTKMGKCRNPQKARPSMSGFGINVSKLMESAGMTYGQVNPELEGKDISIGTVCGLILIGG